MCTAPPCQILVSLLIYQEAVLAATAAAPEVQVALASTINDGTPSHSRSCSRVNCHFARPTRSRAAASDRDSQHVTLGFQFTLPFHTLVD